MIMNLEDLLRDKDKESAKKLRSAIAEWHISLAENRGERAELRRAKSPLDIYISQAFRRGLVERLKSKGMEFGEPDLEKLSLMTGVLAHANNLDNKSPFAALFAKSEKGSVDMKDVRFRRLLSIPENDADGLYLMLIRLIGLMGGQASITGLLECSCFWNDFSRRKWAEAYYSVKR